MPKYWCLRLQPNLRSGSLCIKSRSPSCPLNLVRHACLYMLRHGQCPCFGLGLCQAMGPGPMVITIVSITCNQGGMNGSRKPLPVWPVLIASTAVMSVMAVAARALYQSHHQLGCCQSNVVVPVTLDVLTPVSLAMAQTLCIESKHRW